MLLLCAFPTNITPKYIVIMKNVLFILIILSSSAIAQKVKLVSGSLKPLKGQTSYDIKFTYDSMIVGADKPENIYLDELKKRWEEKERGKGVYFVKSWFDDRKEFYEPLFIANFEKYSRAKLKDSESKYSIIVKTKRTEGGWDGGPMSHPGVIDGELWIVESSDNEKVIAKIIFSNFTGTYSYGGDFEMTTRIRSAYAPAGKYLGWFLKKKSK